MPKKNTNEKYFDAASPAAIHKICLKIDATQKAKRKPKKMKIEPIIPTVIRCLNMGKSSRQIASIVSQLHQISISKDSILRFRKNLTLSI